MTRWIGIDYGAKRIGVAVGDADVRIVTPLAMLSAGDVDLSERIKKIAVEYDAVGVVVGWPMLSDDSEGPQARLARQFASDLAERTGLDVRLWDERLSSFQADERLKGEFTRKQKRRRRDAVAAATILEDFFTGNGPTSAARPADWGDSEGIPK
ncbi:MAG: Holliday junction resolvase RuvX [Planctomycetota bacterium]|nr:Holliday junction resolvase RuvX [Planctomycetota bacterium]